MLLAQPPALYEIAREAPGLLGAVGITISVDLDAGRPVGFHIRPWARVRRDRARDLLGILGRMLKEPFTRK